MSFLKVLVITEIPGGRQGQAGSSTLARQAQLPRLLSFRLAAFTETGSLASRCHDFCEEASRGALSAPVHLEPPADWPPQKTPRAQAGACGGTPWPQLSPANIRSSRDRNEITEAQAWGPSLKKTSDLKNSSLT